MESLGFSVALAVTRDHVLSARPDAPVVPTRPPRAGNGLGPTRRAAAVALRRLADRLEPSSTPICVS